MRCTPHVQIQSNFNYVHIKLTKENGYYIDIIQILGL